MVEYKRCVVYTKISATEPYVHTLYNTQVEALDQVRKLKELLRAEPKLDLVQNEAADVLHFTFPGSPIRGRIVFVKRELEEWVHCPSCSNTLTRDEANRSACHGWECQWVYDGDNGIWRVHTMTKEGL